MPVEPRIVKRDEQPYVAIKALVTMPTIDRVADRISEVFGWIGARGLQPAGAPFLKYNVIDMERELEIEGGIPLATPAEPDGEILAGVLPAGRYATVTHVGHPDELLDVTTALLDWAAAQGLEWDMTETDAGDRWACRLEIYNTDPAVEPDLHKWETELAFRLADHFPREIGGR